MCVCVFSSILVVLFNYLLGLVENMHNACLARIYRVPVNMAANPLMLLCYTMTMGRPLSSVICLLNRVSMCKQSEKCNTALFN